MACSFDTRKWTERSRRDFRVDIPECLTCYGENVGETKEKERRGERERKSYTDGEQYYGMRDGRRLMRIHSVTDKWIS